jgi:hypothetical protein
METLIRRFLTKVTYPKSGTIFKDQFGDYWYSGSIEFADYGGQGIYYAMIHSKWGVWKIDRNIWVKKNGSPHTGIVLKRVDSPITIAV